MSREPLEVVRAHLAAFNAGDAPGTLSLLDPHVVLDVSRVGGIEAPAYGREALAGFVRRWLGTFEEYRFDAERLTDLGSGAVLAVIRETARGKGSGAPVDRSYANLYTVIEGKIARITAFQTEHDALEAAGLSE